MKPYRSLFPAAAVCCGSLLALILSLHAAPDADSDEKAGKAEKPESKLQKDPASRRPPSIPGSDADPFRDLSPEQRDRLREAVRRSWNDPAVIQARDEVKAATDAYQNALRDSLIRTDPDMAGLIEKYRLSSQSDFRGYLAPGMGSGRVPGGNPGPNAPGPPGANGKINRDGKGSEGFLTMENPAFLRDLDDEKKRLYREAHRKAMDNPEVGAQLEALKSLRHQDDEMRKKRTEAIRGLHQSLRKALVEADPRVGEFLPKAHPDGRRSDGESADRRGGKNEGTPLPPPLSPPVVPKPGN